MDSSGQASPGSIVSALTRNSRLFVFAYSTQLKRLVAWTDNAQEILGLSNLQDPAQGSIFLRHVHSDDLYALTADLEKALQGQADYRATYRWIRPDNQQVRWLHCRASLLDQGGEKVLQGMIMDLSEEFTGGLNHFTGPDSLAAVLAALPVMVFSLDHDLRIMRINRSHTRAAFDFGDRAFRHDQFALGRLLLSCFSNNEQREHYTAIMTRLLSGQISHHRARVFMQDAVYSLEIVPLRNDSRIEGLLCMVSDISDLAEVEKQLAELQKSEGLRLLAAGVAHHFNNSLQSILGHASLISSHPGDPRLIREASLSIQEIVKRSSDLTRQLFSADSLKHDAITPVDLNLAAMNAVNRIDGLFSAGIKVTVAFGNPAPVLAAQEEVSEAIEAILRNARESLAGGGTVSIRTYQVSLDDLEVDDLRAGQYSRISISDSGPGMDEETRARCMEPFFTTRSRDPRTGLGLNGRGLGLTRAYAIVRALSGAITIESRPGHGTTVSIYLPVHRTSESTGSISEIKTVPAPEILVVDDDSMVLKTMHSLLRDMGYRCAVAEDFKKALHTVKAHRHDLQLVLLDAVMPGLDGAALLRKIKRICPDLRVIGFSGAPPELTRPLLDAGALKILRKPVDPAALREAIREFIDTRKAVAA